MFANYVFEKSLAQYTDNILLLDDEDLNRQANYIDIFLAHGFEIIRYTDDLEFRIKYEEKLKTCGEKLAIIAKTNQYIPYDIYHRVSSYKIAIENLFPKLNPELLKDKSKVDFDLLSMAYRNNFDDLRKKQDTDMYLHTKVYSRANIEAYLESAFDALRAKAKKAKNYNDWFILAEEKAQIDVIAVQYDIDLDTELINRLFQKYVLSNFGKLSQIIDKESPVLVSKAMDYMNGYSDKFIVIVMDGMSEFDWKIISNGFSDISYEKTSMFAMIPSTTSISRQCLLSGKYPRQLLEPWKLSKEKTEFITCAKSLGYTDSQIGFERGYGAQFGSFVRCGVVVINDIDDMVHAQTQGKLGMFNDINVLAKQKKLFEVTRRFLAEGYDVYITADHGNTQCIGLGKLMGTGVEVETKSRRMIALRAFADKTELIKKYGLIEYPKYYLPKEYDYLICDVGDSFDSKGDGVMTHGGITLDEVVVPFIKIKAVQKHG